ncbi:MAG: stage IV sporulation protein A [Epulopiscium sp.]|nr:stage IV sporulation protein A [Candidatus Epulonipiscium sp.]
MENYDVYKDISDRTNGDIYIGVVGPVRSGKSTFIKRFMEELVIPNINNEHNKERTKDELPQSGDGKMITTTEPKFIPNEAIPISVGEDLEVKVRMIDCVGYMIPDTDGHMYNETPRMVKTPWFDEEIPFAQAAEVGTQKVITDHSTIGIVITTDGSVTEFERTDYEEAEQRVIEELKELGKPFIVVYNTNRPYDNENIETAKELSARYNVPVVPMNVAQIKIDDIHGLLEKVLYEFPLSEMQFRFPRWIETLENDHWLNNQLINQIKEIVYPLNNIREVKGSLQNFKDEEIIKNVFLEKIQLGDGIVKLDITTEDDLFYRILSETTDMEISGDHELIKLIRQLSDVKKEYDKVSYALHEVKQKGYGVVTPVFEELVLEEPKLVKHGNQYAVKLRANAPSYHIIKANIETDISPIVGTEKQSEELVEYLTKEFETDPKKVWESNIFGKSLHELVNEGLQNKLYHMPVDAQDKLQQTLQKVINEGSGGLICIIL